MLPTADFSSSDSNKKESRTIEKPSFPEDIGEEHRETDLKLETLQQRKTQPLQLEPKHGGNNLKLE